MADQSHDQAKRDEEARRRQAGENPNVDPNTGEPLDPNQEPNPDQSNK